MDVSMVNQGGQYNYETSLTESANVNNSNASTNISVSNDQSNNSEESSSNNIKEKDVKKAVDKLNQFLEDDNTHVEYEMHDKFKNDIIIKIVDEAGKTIQEIPPKKLLDVIAKMCEMAGVLLDKKA